MKKNYYGLLILLLSLIDIFIILLDVLFNKTLFLKSILENINVFNFNFKQVLFIDYNILILVGIIWLLNLRYTENKYKEHDKIDIKYIREDLDKINPSYIYYLINMNIDFDKCVNADLLKLINNKIISFKDGRFSINDYTKENLTSTEKFLIKGIKNNTDLEEYKSSYDIEGETFKEAYKQLIINELKKEYIKDNKKILQAESSFLLLLVALLFIFLVFFNFLYLSFFTTKYYADIIFLIMPFIVYVFYYIIIKSLDNVTKDMYYKRTKEGEKLLHKALGLKEFLKNFTNIKDKRLEELNIREYYLIYSIIFNMNDDENDRITKIRKKTLEVERC